jgi:hypothetical protein
MTFKMIFQPAPSDGTIDRSGTCFFVRRCLVVVPALCAAAMCARTMAAEPTGLPKMLRFFGRWDRKMPDRAVTVNSGSYINVAACTP